MSLDFVAWMALQPHEHPDDAGATPDAAARPVVSPASNPVAVSTAAGGCGVPLMRGTLIAIVGLLVVATMAAVLVVSTVN